MEAIIIGQSGTATITVDHTNTAKTVGSGSLDVFATPMMIALMEQAACDAIAKQLSDKETSVGTAVNIIHKAASVVGNTITATATVSEVDNRRIVFNIIAMDGIKEIGKGTHERFVVDIKRFTEKLGQ